MSKKPNTKRALLLSALCMILCASMLIGSTFAWFTDTVTTGPNKIQAGSLEIKLFKLDPMDMSTNLDEVNATDISDSATALFGESINWEPGYTAVANLRIDNVGSLAAKVKANLVAKGEVGKLAEVIDVYVDNGPIRVTEDGVPARDILEGMEFGPFFIEGAKNVGTLKAVLEDSTILNSKLGEEDVLKPGESGYIAIALKMRESATNDYQKASAGEFDISVYAAQATVEVDSYDDQYDADATYDMPWKGEADNAPTVDESGAITITTAQELANFAASVNEGGNSYTGKTVKLGANISLKGAAWTPIGQTGATTFNGIFDGNGFTISDMYINNTDESAHCATGLFGWSESLTVKNLTIDGAVVSGHHNVAAIAGYVYGTIENCHVKNATITCTSVNDDANGDKCGAIAGYLGEDASISNCTVTGSTINAGRDAGQVVGAAKPACVTGCSAKGVSVTSNGTSTGKNINAAVIGREL